MNAHQRRKNRREKEREATKYEVKMIPNPTLKKEFHPHYDGHIRKALETLPTERIIPKETKRVFPLWLSNLFQIIRRFFQ
jgi:hypothetical protein